MMLDFEEPGWVIISITDNVKTILNDAPKDMNGKAATPAVAHLFKANNVDPKLLPPEKKEIFVHLVKQGLYLTQWGHPDIRTAISFLCGQLVKPDWDDYKTLTCLIQYLHETNYMALVLGMDETECVC